MHFRLPITRHSKENDSPSQKPISMGCFWSRPWEIHLPGRPNKRFLELISDAPRKKKQYNKERDINYRIQTSSATKFLQVLSSQTVGAVPRLSWKIPRDRMVDTKHGCRTMRMRRLVCILSCPNWSISIIRALCSSCTVDSRCDWSFGEASVDRSAIFRNIYSSATSKRPDGRAPPSSGIVYVAPDKNIESKRGLEMSPGSKVGKCTTGKCQWREWKNAEIEAEILETPSRVESCIKSRAFSVPVLPRPIDFEVSTNSVIISDSWLESFEGKRVSGLNWSR